ncbi:MAG: hypothetical protein IJT43_11870 [Stomatobaculum sp.]|nr:hypothetical protein [Stomatobaculum sp.]
MTIEQSDEILRMNDCRKAIARTIELADDDILDGLFFVVLSYVRADEDKRRWIGLAAR